MELFLNLSIVGLAVGLIYGLVAVGLSILWTSTDVVNFSHGEFAMLGGFLGYSLLVGLLQPFYVALPTIIACMIFLGLVLYRSVLRPLTKPGMPLGNAILATLGVGIFIRGSVPLIWGTVPLRVPSPFGDAVFTFLGVNIMAHYLGIFAVGGACTVALWFVFEKTMFGLTLKATALSRETARLMGINAGIVVLLSTVFSICLAGISGFIITPITVADIHMGIGIMFKAFAGGIIGGFSNHVSVFLGALLIGVLEVFTTGYISSGYRDVLVFTVLFLILIVRPTGLFVRRSAHE